MGSVEADIVIQAMSFRYPGSSVDALENVSLEIYPGSVTAILGPNGSGKTTLLHLLLGLLTPTRGKILVKGKDQHDLSRRELSREIGLVAQEDDFSFDLPVLEYVLMGRAPYLKLLQLPDDRDYELAVQALAQLGIGDMAHRSVTTLSGGERQLVTFARVLVQQPSILLLDEPTSHLDLPNTHQILQLVKAMSRQGKTMIFTTHYPNSIPGVASSVILMRAGRVIAAGPSSDMLSEELLSQTYGVEIEVHRSDQRTFVAVRDQSTYSAR